MKTDNEWWWWSKAPPRISLWSLSFFPLKFKHTKDARLPSADLLLDPWPFSQHLLGLSSYIFTCLQHPLIRQWFQWASQQSFQTYYQRRKKFFVSFSAFWEKNTFTVRCMRTEGIYIYIRCVYTYGHKWGKPDARERQQTTTAAAAAAAHR